MKAFETGETYSTRSACDSNCIISLTVISRTAKTIISTEFMDKELIGFDEALGSRIVEKSFQIQVLRSQGRNFRTK